MRVVVHTILPALLGISLALSGCSGDPATSDADADDGPFFGGGKADVTVGAIVSLSCSAAESFVRRGGATEVTVDARDSLNQRSRNYDVRVDPASATRVVQRNKVIFDSDGTYDITCCALDSDRCDRTTVLVGEQHPALAVTATRFLAAPGKHALRGHARAIDGSHVRVTAGGQTVDAAADGSFEIAVDAVSGSNRYDVVATDAAGRTSQRLAWTLAGPFGAVHEPLPDTVRVGMSAAAFPALNDLLSRAAHAFISKPGRFDLDAWREDGSKYGYKWEIQPRGLGVGSTDVRLEPTPSGLQVHVALRNAWFETGIRTKLLLLPWAERDARADFAEIKLTGLLQSDGSSLRFSAPALTFDGSNLEVSSLPGLIEDVLLERLQEIAVDEVTGKASEAADSKLNGILNGFRQTKTLTLPPPLHGALTADTRLTSMHVDETGLGAGLSVEIDGETDPRRIQAPGPWLAGSGVPQLTQREPYEAGFSVDVLNALFFAAWQTGALDVSYTSPDGRDLLRGVAGVTSENLEVFVEVLQPPVVQPGETAGEVSVAFGEIRVDVVFETSVGVVNMAAVAGATLRGAVYAETGALKVAAGVEDVAIDILVAPATFEREPTRRVVEAVVAQDLLPKLSNLAAALPIPSADLSDLGVPGLTTLSASGLKVLESPTYDTLLLGASLDVR